MEIIFRPIDQWPREQTRTPKRSQFKTQYSTTLQLLDRELVTLRAKNIVIQIDLTESDIRLDGLPRSTAKPASPRVILSFDSKHGPLKYYSDTFDAWQDNLRAIALGLEHLRAVDRYGITKRGEQYTGWKALPGPGPQLTPPTMTIEEASIVIANWGQWSSAEVFNDPEKRRAAYRHAVKRAHPDAGGTPECFILLQRAMELLEKVGVQ
jgi:hypothetical protein